jgi:competence protein ComEA
MATVATKVNVNTATREELVDVAGLRPELADTIIRFRDERGKITKADELEEVQGVGPATLEQLRKALSFGETAEEKAERERTKAVQEAERTARETAERTADAAASTLRSTVEIGRSAAKAGSEAASSAAQGGLQLVQRTAGAMTKVQRETAQQSAEGTAELGKLWLELLGEQTRHNLVVATTLSKAVDWEEMVRVQSEYLRASIERMNQLNSRYLEIVRSMMTAAALTAEGEAKKAA